MRRNCPRRLGSPVDERANQHGVFVPAIEERTPRLQYLWNTHVIRIHDVRNLHTVKATHGGWQRFRKFHRILVVHPDRHSESAQSLAERHELVLDMEIKTPHYVFLRSTMFHTGFEH